MTPAVGATYAITSAASVQFSLPIRFLVTAVAEYGSTPAGWVWLTGYQVDARGMAVERRELFVQADGLIPIDAPGRRDRRRQVNRGPAPAPRRSPSSPVSTSTTRSIR